MVPIIEPEILMDGEHNIKKCYDVTAKVLNEFVNSDLAKDIKETEISVSKKIKKYL